MLFLLGLVVTALALAVVENVQLARSQLLPDLGAPTPEEGDDSPLSPPEFLESWLRASRAGLDVGSSRSRPGDAAGCRRWVRERTIPDPGESSAPAGRRRWVTAETSENARRFL